MAMNTLDELKYYCKEKKPAGALMLIGEWGCGKTYLIDNTLSDELKDSHVFIRISLFGISSMEAVSTAVKQAWIEACLKHKGSIGKWMKKAFDAREAIATVAGTVNETAGAVLSFDISKFAAISQTIGEKTVVLVFDDLERCRIDPVDLLGVINDYCENQKFHTIIVANEDYMLQQDKRASDTGKSNKDSAKETREDPHASATTKQLSYAEIKEKIVQRTVRIVPDYNSIIKSVVESYATDDEDYKQFLVNQTEGLQNLFNVGIPMAEATLKESGINKETLAMIMGVHNPHNIRSFRCAIQDFHRVFDIIKKHGITDSLDEWLYAFVMFIMAHRAGAVTGDERYGGIFTDAEVSQLYRSFYKDKYMLGFEKAWVLQGEWNEKLAVAQIEELIERQKAATPYDIVRTHQLEFIDEEVFNEGFPQVLEKAYCGELAIDDYIRFICNTASARMYQFELPVVVDWNKVESGIRGKLESMIQQGREDSTSRQYISNDNLDILNDEERSVYALIDEFRKGEKIIFAKNRKDFLDLMQTDHSLAFSKLKNRRFEYFDEEMAERVVQTFIKCSNSEKIPLIGDFKDMWGLIVQAPDIDPERTLVGFNHLYTKLLEAKNSVDKAKTITLSNYDRFIESAEIIIAKIKDFELPASGQ